MTDKASQDQRRLSGDQIVYLRRWTSSGRSSSRSHESSRRPDFHQLAEEVTDVSTEIFREASQEELDRIAPLSRIADRRRRLSARARRPARHHSQRPAAGGGLVQPTPRYNARVGDLESSLRRSDGSQPGPRARSPARGLGCQLLAPLDPLGPRDSLSRGRRRFVGPPSPPAQPGDGARIRSWAARRRARPERPGRTRRGHPLVSRLDASGIHSASRSGSCPMNAPGSCSAVTLRRSHLDRVGRKFAGQ